MPELAQSRSQWRPQDFLFLPYAGLLSSPTHQPASSAVLPSSPVLFGWARTASPLSRRSAVMLWASAHVHPRRDHWRRDGRNGRGGPEIERKSRRSLSRMTVAAERVARSSRFAGLARAASRSCPDDRHAREVGSFTTLPSVPERRQFRVMAMPSGSCAVAKRGISIEVAPIASVSATSLSLGADREVWRSRTPPGISS